jgi:hypothetical protein
MLPCHHRGEIVSTLGCGGCQSGLPPCPIYSCPIHGECTVNRVEAGIVWCGRCSDRTTDQSSSSSSSSSLDQ